jgi:hypothetical protein
MALAGVTDKVPAKSSEPVMHHHVKEAQQRVHRLTGRACEQAPGVLDGIRIHS